MYYNLLEGIAKQGLLPMLLSGIIWWQNERCGKLEVQLSHTQKLLDNCYNSRIRDLKEGFKS